MSQTATKQAPSRTSLLDPNGRGVGALITVHAFGVNADDAGHVTERVLPIKQANGTATVVTDALTGDRYELTMLVANPKQVCGEDLSSPVKKVTGAERVEVVAFQGVHASPQEATPRRRPIPSQEDEMRPEPAASASSGKTYSYALTLRRPSAALAREGERARAEGRWNDDPTRLALTYEGFQAMRAAVVASGLPMYGDYRPGPDGRGVVESFARADASMFGDRLRALIEGGRADERFRPFLPFCDRAASVAHGFDVIGSLHDL